MTTTETQPAPEAEEPAAAIEAPVPAEKPPLWQRPMVDRYIVPLVLPIAILIGLAMFVINMSRIFLAGHGNSAVIIGTLITVSILLGAAMLSAAPKLRSSSLALVTVGFVGSIVLAGWLSLGSAAEKEEEGGALPPEGGALSEVQFSTVNLTFVPNSADATTGIHTVTLTSGGGTHTLAFVDPEVSFEEVKVDATGDTASARAFFAAEGDYQFFCTIPGHREAGMEGVISATGETMTLEAALAAVEGAPGAEGGAPGTDEGGPAGGGAEGEEAPAEGLETEE